MKKEPLSFPNRPGFGMGYVQRLQMEWFLATYGQRALISDQVKAERPPPAGGDRR